MLQRQSKISLRINKVSIYVTSVHKIPLKHLCLSKEIVFFCLPSLSTTSGLKQSSCFGKVTVFPGRIWSSPKPRSCGYIVMFELHPQGSVRILWYRLGTSVQPLYARGAGWGGLRPHHQRSVWPLPPDPDSGRLPHFTGIATLRFTWLFLQ